MRAIIAILLSVAAAPLIAQPAVTIVKSTNGQDANTPPGAVVPVGSTVTWTYLVSNTGGRDLINITVADDPIGTIACPATTLAAGSSMTCTTTGIAVAGQYTNTATVNATEVGGGPVSASDLSHYFGQPAGLITIAKATNGQDANSPPGPAIAVGAAVNWTYIVTNTDTQSITSVVVTDDRGVAVTCPQNTLAASESMTCTASGLAVTGQYSNTGIVTATHPTFGTIVASDPSHYFGQNLDFDFGDAPASYGTPFGSNGPRHVLDPNIYLGACVDAELDAQLTGDETNVGTSTFGTCAVPGADEDGVTFNGAMTVGQTASITVVANAPCTLSAWIDFDANGTFSEPNNDIFPGGTALVAGINALTFGVPSTAPGGLTYARFRCTTDGLVGPAAAARDGEVEDYAVTIVPSADVSITKTDTPDPVSPGASLTYTITVGNGGPSSASTVTMSDTLPANTTFFSLTSPGGWTCSTPAVGAPGTVSCGRALLPPGSSSFTLVVTVDPAANPGSTLSNTATVTSTTADPVAGNNSSTATTTAGAGLADVSVTKTGAPDPVNAGTNLTYTITISNGGPSLAATVALSDTLPANTTFVSLTSPGGWACTTPAAGAAGTVSCSSASLAPGNAVFTLVVAVSAAATTGTAISNTATVASTTSDPVAANNSSTATTTLGFGQADLSVTKAGGPDPVAAGTDLTYTITVGNAGPGAATTTALSDPLPPNTTFVSLTSPGGWTCTTPGVGSAGTISCTIASMPPGSAAFTLVVKIGPTASPAAAISNTATISSATTDPTPGNNTATATTSVLNASIPAMSREGLLALLLMLAVLGAITINRNN